jgi:phosphatidylserine/phosphatidylglycerophosphate/cardiolipin synthase-like enzyme
MSRAPTAAAIDQIIRQHILRLRKAGVLTVRPGFEIARHQLTGKSAIVATVHTKKPLALLPKADLLPSTLGGVPVDVREASAHQRLRAHDPLIAAVTQAYGGPQDVEPEWPLEREMPSGKLLSSASSDTQKAMVRARSTQPAAGRALEAHASKATQQIPYVPASRPLDPVSVTTTITAHVSPDAGLTTLEDFLQGTQHSLTLGMYDFTSGTILKALLSDLTAPKSLQMVLDNPAPNPTRDQTDTQTVQELDQNLGDRSRIARALVHTDVFAARWMFPFAYHIKVIVRDGSSFWLSSGNLNNSNQPNLASPPTTEDRDWHVIIQNPSLSQTFEAYLNQDYLSASQNQAPSPQANDKTLEDAYAKLAAEENPPSAPHTLARTKGTAANSVAAKTFKNIQLEITPLLTPDTLPDSKQGQYLSHIMQLIQGAQHSLYIQLQYIESSSGKGDPYDLLLQAILAKAKAGVDVRLIQSLQFGEKWAEQMKSIGADLTAWIRLQPDVHNKGFVVDSKTVVVSSQNFSPSGVQTNRDAAVIMQSADIAGYFEPIFLADWSNKAKPFAEKKKRGS